MTANRYPLVICMTIALHLIWAWGLLMDGSAAQATAVHALLLTVTYPTEAAAVLVGISLLALLGLVAGPRFWLLIILQQGLLVMSAMGCVNAMWLGHFADGVERSQYFLLVDQIPLVIWLVAHTLGIYFFHKRGELGI